MSESRAVWEMERVLPARAVEARAKAGGHINAGRLSRAEPMLDRLTADVRCLDAQARDG
jgi:hypothetical protein